MVVVVFSAIILLIIIIYAAVNTKDDSTDFIIFIVGMLAFCSMGIIINTNYNANHIIHKYKQDEIIEEIRITGSDTTYYYKFKE